MRGRIANIAIMGHAASVCAKDKTEPLVAIEVMSPTSQRRDCDVKRAFYLAMPAIQHVVMVGTLNMAIWHDARIEGGYCQTMLRSRATCQI